MKSIPIGTIDLAFCLTDCEACRHTILNSDNDHKCLPKQRSMSGRNARAILSSKSVGRLGLSQH